MADYLHGAYARIQNVGSKAAIIGQSVIVYVGTAPVHTLPGGAENVNKPVLINNIAEARRLFGYSDDWDDYTLCEAMKAHLENQGVGPLIFINVLDPDTHQLAEGGSVNLTPSGGRIVITAAESIILDSVVVKTTGDPAVTKALGTDYTIAYDFKKKTITLAEITAGALGTEALAITYDIVDPSAVDADTIIGASDGLGVNTGLYAIANVYQETGFIPAMLLVPGFSSLPAVHSAMYLNTQKVNGHWDVYMLADIPIVDSEAAAVTLDSAITWKTTNGYNKENETVYFPLAKGTDGAIYHLSVLAAANFQALLLEQNGIPYKTASNTPCPIIQNLYLGEAAVGRVYDDTTINKKLNQNGVASAAFVGGQWVIWGCHSANYNQTDADQINVSETNRMMLYYISNDFQRRRTRNVDKPLSDNDLRTIKSEEQARLDALVQIGALAYGEVHISSEPVKDSDVYEGDYAFTFNITTTPLARSLTAIVNWTADGFVTYFAD